MLPRFAAFAAAALLAAPAAAQAQPDPAARQLIEQLRPQTRGIRLPGAEAPPAGTPPAAAPGAKTAPRETTAPPGVPAASITVTFATGSAALTPGAEAALAPLGRALSSAELAPYRFRIEGHTDTVGEPGMNQALSERRAAAVRDYLTARFGVDAGRLETVGLGETQPLVRTGDEVAEPRNRRVQVLNLGG